MAGNSTVYDVRVRYALEDKASKGASSMASSFDKAHDSVFSLHNAIKALAVEKIFEKGKELLIDFNQEMDNLKISMTTVMQMNMHMPFEKASAAADKLFDTFQEMAKKSPLMTKDFMEMAAQIAPAVSMAGGGVDKLQKMTQGALTAGLAFNVRPEQMAMDIQEMFAGNVRLTSRTARQLLASQGLDHNEFNKKSATERAGITEKILTDPAVLNASARASHTLAGESSTFKDNIQIALGQVGRPLMTEMTKQMAQMNHWIERHPKLISEYVGKFGGMIKDAFGFFKSVAGWMVDNSNLLFSLGKIFLVFKGAQLGTNVIKGFVGSMGDMVKSVKNAGGAFSGLFSGGVGGLVGRFGALGSAIGGALPVIGLFTGALEVAATLLNGHNEDDKKAKDAQMSLHEAVSDFPDLQKRRKDLTDILAGKGPQGGMAQDPNMRQRFQSELDQLNSKVFDPEKMGTVLKKISEESKAHGGSDFSMLTMEQMRKPEAFIPSMFDSRDAAKSAEVTNEVLSFFKTFNNISQDAREQALKYAFPEQFGAPDKKEIAAPDEGWKGPKSADINVTIQKIEVASEDPDRFVFGIAKIGENAAKHPTASQHTLVGGF